MESTPTKHDSHWQLAAAYMCFFSAIVSAVTGFLLTTESILKATLHPLIHDLGIVLLILVIPLLILGGHCLDLREKHSKNSNIELDTTPSASSER